MMTYNDTVAMQLTILNVRNAINGCTHICRRTPVLGNIERCNQCGVAIINPRKGWIVAPADVLR